LGREGLLLGKRLGRLLGGRIGGRRFGPDLSFLNGRKEGFLNCVFGGQRRENG